MRILDEILLPYQRAWVADTSRFKIGLWSRQTGKSFATAAEAVLSSLTTPNDTWVVLSAGERQALEWMEKAKKWAEATGAIIDSYKETRDYAEALIKQAEIRFRNGSRIIAIPANPATARGYSANLVLDEFAIHEKPFDIWAAIYPSITNPLSGEKKLRIVSTPRGRGNKFADLWEHNDAYSKHKITILDAQSQGLPIDIEELKRGVDDPDIWAQEYMCEFVDNSSILLPYELLGSCESIDLYDDGESPLYIGMDIGRSRDLSVIVVLQRVGDVLQCVRVETLTRMQFRDQLRVLQELCESAARRVKKICIDSTGIGAMLAEEARITMGGKVEPVQFNVANKGEMYTALRRKFEDRLIRIPVDRALREDLHAVQKSVSMGGTVSYSAPRSTDGHSDRAAALALAIRAATCGRVSTPPRVARRRLNYLQRKI